MAVRWAQRPFDLVILKSSVGVIEYLSSYRKSKILQARALSPRRYEGCLGNPPIWLSPQRAAQPRHHTRSCSPDPSAEQTGSTPWSCVSDESFSLQESSKDKYDCKCSHTIRESNIVIHPHHGANGSDACNTASNTTETRCLSPLSSRQQAQGGGARQTRSHTFSQEYCGGGCGA